MTTETTLSTAAQISASKLTLAQKIAACQVVLKDREAERVAACTAKHKSGAKYARAVKRNVNKLLADLTAQREAAKTAPKPTKEKAAPKAKSPKVEVTSEIVS